MVADGERMWRLFWKRIQKTARIRAIKEGGYAQNEIAKADVKAGA